MKHYVIQMPCGAFLTRMGYFGHAIDAKVYESKTEALLDCIKVFFCTLAIPHIISLEP